MTNRIEFHADDFGLFPDQSDRIIDCYENGALNGISIMPNSPYLKECMDKISNIKDELYLAIHLNLIEGKRLSPLKEKSGISDSRGVFNSSFGKLLFVSYIPGLNTRYREEIRDELKTQIEACLPYYEGRPIRLDSHCHYHMVPVVFDALAEVIRVENYDVEYIRIPYENKEYYRGNSFDGFKSINLLKVFILNYLAGRNRRKHQDIFSRLKPACFMGVYLSGRMSFENVSKVLEKAKSVLPPDQHIEVLFHPGSVLEKKDFEVLTFSGDKEFLTEAWRQKEADALKTLMK